MTDHIPTSTELLENGEDLDELIGLAFNPSTSPAVLKQISEDEDEWVRSAVAENPSTPLEVLERFKDDEEDVRLSLACNPSASASILDYLFCDPSQEVRDLALDNPNFSIQTLFTVASNGMELTPTAQARLSQIVEEYRKKENLDDVPDSYIVKLLATVNKVEEQSSQS